MGYTTTWQDEVLMSRAVKEGAEESFSREKSDFQLIELILEGNEDAFEKMFDRYKRLVARIASRYFQRPEQIDEIIQISFTKVYLELKYFRNNHDQSFISWLGKITTNACLDALRTQKRKPANLACELSEAENERFLEDAQKKSKTAENFVIERDLAEKLLSRLEAHDRAILQMLDLEGMNLQEVAEICGWSKSKVKMRAFRARRVLRKISKRFL